MIIDNLWDIALAVLATLVSAASLMILSNFYYQKILDTVTSSVKGQTKLDTDIRLVRGKRIFDILVSLWVILFIMSWLFPIICILIRLESRGPALFKQLRYSKNNETKFFYRFRTMKVYMKTSDTIELLAKSDSRITKVGRFLRLTGLDSLPMFINVLLGDASVVGLSMLSSFSKNRYAVSPDYNKVLVKLKPGVISLFSISSNMIKSDSFEYEKFDVYYAKHQSLLFDLKIFLAYFVVLLGLSTKN